MLLRSRRRLVRIHQDAGPTFEGILVARGLDSYRLAMPKMLEAEDQTVSLDGEVEVPRERVVFVQLLARAA